MVEYVTDRHFVTLSAESYRPVFTCKYMYYTISCVNTLIIIVFFNNAVFSTPTTLK